MVFTALIGLIGELYQPVWHLRQLWFPNFKFLIARALEWYPMGWLFNKLSLHNWMILPAINIIKSAHCAWRIEPTIYYVGGHFPLTHLLLKYLILSAGILHVMVFSLSAAQRASARQSSVSSAQAPAQTTCADEPSCSGEPPHRRAVSHASVQSPDHGEQKEKSI